jgi:UMF1 family MFS transporter
MKVTCKTTSDSGRISLSGSNGGDLIMGRKMNKTEWSWVLYDVGNSAFTMLTTALVPIYFAAMVANTSTIEVIKQLHYGELQFSSDYNTCVSFTYSRGDSRLQGHEEKDVCSCAVSWRIRSIRNGIYEYLACFFYIYVIARIGYSATNVFYDSMLTDVTTDDRMDRVSSNGFAYGYIGSCIPFILCLAIYIFQPFGLNDNSSIQVAFVITGLWWFLLTIPLFRNVRQTYYLENQKGKVKDAFLRIANTFKNIKKKKEIFLFILAYFFYIDGVYTIITMATIYGTELGLDSVSMVLALLLTQFIAFPCAILAGILGTKYGTLKIIKVFIGIYMFVAVFGFFLVSEWQFWVLAVIVGMAQGGIQSLSRGFFGRIIPKEESNEYFGFFDIFGKLADIMGPLLMGLFAIITGHSRYGILSLILLFIVGFILLSRLPKGFGEIKLNTKE